MRLMIDDQTSAAAMVRYYAAGEDESVVTAGGPRMRTRHGEDIMHVYLALTCSSAERGSSEQDLVRFCETAVEKLRRGADV